jgi:hypothetical protein
MSDQTTNDGGFFGLFGKKADPPVDTPAAPAAPVVPPAPKTDDERRAALEAAGWELVEESAPGEVRRTFTGFYRAEKLVNGRVMNISSTTLQNLLKQADASALHAAEVRDRKSRATGEDN